MIIGNVLATPFPEADPRSANNTALRALTNLRNSRRLSDALAALLAQGLISEQLSNLVTSIGCHHDSLADPYFRFWLLRANLAQKHGKSMELIARQLSNVVLPTVLQSGDTAAISKLSLRTDREGQVHSCGWTLNTGRPIADCELVRLGPSPHEVGVRFAGEVTTSSCTLIEHSRIGESISVDASHPWLVRRREEIARQATAPENPTHDAGAPKLSHDKVVLLHRQAFAFLISVWPELAAEIASDVRVVSPFSGNSLNGWADVYLLGLVFVREEDRDLPFVLERLVHQAAHVTLFLITHGPLHTHSPSHLMASPIRKDLRPVNGVFHAMFVYARLIALFRRVDEAWASRRASELEIAFLNGVKSIRACELTSRGQHLLDSMAQIAE